MLLVEAAARAKRMHASARPTRKAAPRAPRLMSPASRTRHPTPNTAPAQQNRASHKNLSAPSQAARILSPSAPGDFEELRNFGMCVTRSAWRSTARRKSQSQSHLPSGSETEGSGVSETPRAEPANWDWS